MLITVTAISCFILACAAAGLIVARLIPATQAQTSLAIQRADQAEVELARIRERRYPHPTVEMLEDLSSVLLDLDHELRMSYRYFLARLKNADQILAAGRPGPYSYTQADTHNRPARPGAAVKTWTM